MGLRTERIVALRKKYGLRQKDIAEKLGVPQHQISKYENDQVKPPLDRLVLMAQMLGTTTDYLLGATDIPEPQVLENLSPHELAVIDMMHNQDEATQRKMAETLRQMVAIWGDEGAK